jgi:methionine-gamma-lyase
MTENAQHVAAFLQSDPRVTRVHYVGLLAKDSPQFAIAQKQCTSPGSMIAFQVPGGEAEAFRVLNALKVIRLAVSLGGTESLAEHPASMTHVDVDPVERAAMGIDDNMIRLSVGVENVNDLIWDLDQALSTLSR